MKIQVIRPIYKKGVKKDLDNYRPIAILPSINKIIEKFFSNKLQSFLEKENIIINDQFGFQKNKGTNEALKKINDDICKALHEGKHVGAIFIDLQKAFDTINRHRLKRKMLKYGIDKKLCAILGDYLDHRSSCVRLGKNYSDLVNINYGVPQGSILGPILFLIYINDIKGKNNLNVTLFADDILCLAIGESYEELIEQLQQNLNKLQTWCLDNELYISEEKTKFMIFKHEEREMKLFIHGEKCNRLNCKETCNEINQTENIKYLGLEIDTKWNFDIHIDNIIKKLRQITPKLYCVKKLLSCKNKKIIYDSWIKSHLQYGLEIYGCAKAKEINRLQKIQNKIIKILFGSRSYQKTTHIFEKHQILTIKQLFEYNIIIKYFFQMKTLRENKIKAKIYPTTKFKFQPILTKNKFGEKVSTYYIPNIFNKLSEPMWNLKSYNKLKIETKRFILGEGS